LRQLPLIQRKHKLQTLIEKSGLSDMICGKYVEERGIDLFNVVCKRNLEGVVAKRKSGRYATVSGWLKIKNPNYTQSERRYELFEYFKGNNLTLVPIPKKPPVRTRGSKTAGVSMKRHNQKRNAVSQTKLKSKINSTQISQ
jgi:hypothetical protein